MNQNHKYKINTLNKGTTIHRAAPYIGLQKGNGKATSTNHNFAWFVTSKEGAEPYVIVQDHLNNTRMSRIFNYEVLKNLSFIDLSNAKTLRKLNADMTRHGYGNMLGSFIINNGQVKRVSGVNQFARNKNTANRLRTFLLKYHPDISGWRHGNMERPRGGFQGGEILMFTPSKRVEAPAARGSVAPSLAPSLASSPLRQLPLHGGASHPTPRGQSRLSPKGQSRLSPKQSSPRGVKRSRPSSRPSPRGLSHPSPRAHPRPLPSPSASPPSSRPRGLSF